ncbi:MAG: hypothetical protein K0S61_287 [Anaerocolumna sp.]|jgi:hypothetical protein|nr:hypothetical protein [Anaerocolumna sp.]
MNNPKKEELKVYMSIRDTHCQECKVDIQKNDFITFDKEGHTLCLSCSDLNHLVFLPSGDTALTTRARKYSTLSAVVYKFSSARKRNERQGVLVELSALEKAEKECLVDEDAREKKRKRDAIRREKLDLQYVEQFAKAIREQYPNCPNGRELDIAEHACEKNSGRVGRTAAAKKFDKYEIDLAVIAHIRHTETSYDRLLVEGYDRIYAREAIKEKIDEVKDKWAVEIRVKVINLP